MTNSSRPLAPIVPAMPDGDRRPTLLRPNTDRGSVFPGWGPKI